jgi:hypothetical protein
VYPKFIIYHSTPIDSTCFFFCYIIQLATGVERTQNLLYIIQRRIYHSTAYWSGVYPKFTIYHPTPIGATHAFRLLYINQLPTGVERTQNLLYIIQRRSELLALFLLLYHSTAYTGVERTQNLLYILQRQSELLALFFCYIIQLPILEWSVPKIYCISSNAGRSDSRFLFAIYQSTTYWSGAYPKFIAYHSMPIDYPDLVQIVHGSTAFYPTNPIKI